MAYSPRICWKCYHSYYRRQVLEVWVVHAGRPLFKMKVPVCLKCLTPAKATMAILAAVGARSLPAPVRKAIDEKGMALAA